MKIWFGATSKNIVDFYPTYKSICNHIKKKRHVILFDWVDCAYDLAKSGGQHKRNIKKIFRKVLSAIEESDAVVIENTIPNFSVAHQIIFSVMRRKPTLVLWQKKDNQLFTDSYLEAMESEFLTVVEYKEGLFSEALDEFLGINEVGFGKKRYNVVLGDRQRYYLDWASNEKRKSRSEIIREALETLSEKDNRYKKYISDK